MAEPEKVVCRTCNYLYLPAQGRAHGKTFQCSTCIAAERLLRYHLGEKHGLNKMSASEACKFFRDIHARKQDTANGRLSWNTTRAVLVTHQTDKRMESFKNSVKGKELPLDVWLAQGWKKEVVERQENFFS